MSRYKPKNKPGSKEVRAFISEEAHTNGVRTAKAVGVTMTILVERLFLEGPHVLMAGSTVPRRSHSAPASPPWGAAHRASTARTAPVGATSMSSAPPAGDRAEIT